MAISKFLKILEKINFTQKKSKFTQKKQNHRNQLVQHCAYRCKCFCVCAQWLFEWNIETTIQMKSLWSETYKWCCVGVVCYGMKQAWAGYVVHQSITININPFSTFHLLRLHIKSLNFIILLLWLLFLFNSKFSVISLFIILFFGYHRYCLGVYFRVIVWIFVSHIFNWIGQFLSPNFTK